MLYLPATVPSYENAENVAFAARGIHAAGTPNITKSQSHTNLWIKACHATTPDPRKRVMRSRSACHAVTISVSCGHDRRVMRPRF